VEHRQLSLAATAHDRHHTVALLEAASALAEPHDFARQLQPGDVLGRAGRRRVAAAALKHVGSVQARAAHPDEDLAPARLRVGPLLDHQLLVLDGYGSHPWGNVLPVVAGLLHEVVGCGV
jgi:hypothetical protein